MNIKLVGIDRYGMVEDDFGAEYFWKLWNEIYDSVEIETALSGPEDADRIFFFNPFSVEILKSVMHRIKESWYGNPRQILLLFYYIQDEYVSYLMAMDELMFVDEIDCRDLFEGVNPRERIMVFEMG